MQNLAENAAMDQKQAVDLTVASSAVETEVPQPAESQESDKAAVATGQAKGKRYLWLPNGVDSRGTKVHFPFIFVVIAISQLVGEEKLKASDTPIAEGDQFAGENNKNVGMYPVVTNEEETAEVLSLGGKLHQDKKDADKKRSEARANQPKSDQPQKNGKPAAKAAPRLSPYMALSKRIDEEKSWMSEKAEKTSAIKPILANLLTVAMDLVNLKLSGKVTDETVANLDGQVTITHQLAEMAILEKMIKSNKDNITRNSLTGDYVASSLKKMDEALALASSDPGKMQEAKNIVSALHDPIDKLVEAKRLASKLKAAIKESGLVGSVVESISEKAEEAMKLASADPTKSGEAKKAIEGYIKDVQLMSHANFVPKLQRGKSRKEQQERNRDGRRPDARNAVVPSFSDYPKK